MKLTPFELRAQMLRYLRVPPGAPWRWEDDGRVLVWSDGTTIAFREEINAVLDRLALRGRPPFAAVAVLLAACRGKLPVAAPLPETGGTDSRKQLLRSLAFRNYTSSLAELNLLAELPAALVKSTPDKVALAAALLETLAEKGGRSEVTEQGQLLLFGDVELNEPAPDAATLDLPAVCRSIAVVLQGHTAESLTRLVKTGLTTLPEPIPEVGLPPAPGVRRLLGELAADDSFAGLVAATRDLMAAIRLPTAIVAVEELALGGASGLGNRGPLDRLLLSELAHDDLTLAARIALNEALYLQREPPVLKPEQALVIVLDSGLRMWGVPRLMGISAALALVAGHRGTGAVSVWRPEDTALAPVDTFTRKGLEDHLEVLCPELDPRAALPAVDDLLDPAANTDVVFITHRDALREEAFAAGLAQVRARRHFVLTVDATGGAALHTLPWGALRPLAQTQTDPNRLQEPRRRAKAQPPQVRDEVVDGDWPAIFRERPFPLRMPVTGQVEGVAAVGKDGGLAAMADHRLLAWDTKQHGARQLLTGLPGGRLVFLLRDAQRRIAVGKAGAERELRVTILHEGQDAPLVALCNARRAPLAVFPYGDVLLLVLHTRVTAISLETGALLQECRYPEGLRWRSGRYFVSDQEVHYVFWNGSSVQWDNIPSIRLPTNVLALVFDREEIGPWLLLVSGEIRAPDGTAMMKVGFRTLGAVTLDEGNLLLVTDEKGVQHAVNLRTRDVRVQPRKVEALARDLVPVPTQPVRTRLAAVCGQPGEPLRLRKRNGDWLEIDATGARLRLTSAGGQWPDHERRLRNFSEPSGAPGCSLRVATWPGGSRVWLDSRGLLHLRSGDPEVPELTLTLNDGMMAAWDSRGGLDGPAFFTGEKTDQNTPRAVVIYREFCAKLC